MNPAVRIINVLGELMAALTYIREDYKYECDDSCDNDFPSCDDTDCRIYRMLERIENAIKEGEALMNEIYSVIDVSQTC